MKNPIVVTSLEEDFRKIGLIKAESKQAEDVSEDTDLDEVKKQKLTRGGTRSAPTRAGHKKYVALMRTPEGKLRARAKNKAAKKAPARRQAAKLRRKREAKGLADSFGRTGPQLAEQNEALKAFANAAIIADKLAGIFTEWVKADIYESQDERMFAALAGELAEIAESFADIATAMHEGRLEEGSEDVAEAFSEGLEVVLDAVDLYEANADEDEAESDDEDESGNE